MAICTYFMRGSCKFGNTCRNSHVVDGANKTTNSSPLPGPDSFETISRTMQDDLTSEKPLYYLSVYSPHKSAINMIDGTDVSPEELRFQAYQARANNTTSQYVAHETQLLQQMDSVIKMVTQNSKESYKHFYHTQMPLNHPNSTFRKPSPGVTSFGAGSFGSTNKATGFGPAGMGFGGSSTGAFGAFSSQASSTPAVSAFGQPSSVGPAMSAFGQQTSAFGTPSSAQPGTATAFGKPSAFGSAAPVASAFGAPAAPSAFGQPSQFGTTSAFGAASSPQTTATSAFGMSSQPTSVFGTTPQTTGMTGFGTSSQPTTTTAFGAVSSGTTAFGSNTQSVTSNPSAGGAFGQPGLNNPTSLFGQATGAATGFGQSSGFGQPQTPSAFGKPSAFGQSAFGKPAAFGQSGFGQASTFGGTSTNNPSMSPQTTTTPGFGQSSAVGGVAAPFGQSPSIMTTPPSNNSRVADNGPIGNGGFAAFAGSSNPSLATNTSSNLNPPTSSSGPQDPKPVISAFENSSQADPPSSSFFGSTVDPTQSRKPKSPASSSSKDFKLVDPFWADAPTENDLSPALLEAFKADLFAWDCIPDLPPPLSLR